MGDFFSGDAPGAWCARCDQQHEWVRPGKTQPTCDCADHCWAHGNIGVPLEYRGEDHPANVASKKIGHGMGLGYHCPTCEAEHDAQICAMAAAIR